MVDPFENLQPRMVVLVKNQEPPYQIIEMQMAFYKRMLESLTQSNAVNIEHTKKET